ncbi:MAG: ribonuclease HIII [Chlamydiales bacterium]|nr:ribonuclease HIII [Chlamydiales bacterium]
MKKQVEPTKYPSCFVTELDTSLATKLQEDLEGQGFALTKPNYTFFSAKKQGVSCTFYLSGKLTVQGNEMSSFIEFYLEPEILKNFAFTHPELLVDKTPHIGVDESGKGDFFGPLCIAGVFAGDSLITELSHLGVKDSKSLTDKTILELSKQIRTKCIHHIITINPKRYNELYAQCKNLNTLLGWAHASIIEALVEKSGCRDILIDQFAHESVVINALKKKNLSVNLSQKHRGEEDLVVAAASILARSAFIEGLEKLSLELNIQLPKGASSKIVEVGKNIVSLYGEEGLKTVSKTHFKTYQQIVDIL